MGKRNLLAALAITGVVAATAVGGAPMAGAAPAAHGPASLTGSFDCGIITCSYVFSKNHTKTIANDGLAAAGLCAAIPTPGNGICAAGFAVIVVTAKVAKSKGKCVKLNWPKVPPFGTFPSIDGGKRCK